MPIRCISALMRCSYQYWSSPFTPGAYPRRSRSIASGGSGDSTPELAPCSDSVRHVISRRSVPLDNWFGKDYNIAVSQTPQFHVDSQSVAGSHRAKHAARTVPGGVFLFWRWLTCGHGHHDWKLQAGLDLARHGVFVVVARACPRCDLVEVLE